MCCCQLKPNGNGNDYSESLHNSINNDKSPSEDNNISENKIAPNSIKGFQAGSKAHSAMKNIAEKKHHISHISERVVLASKPKLDQLSNKNDELNSLQPIANSNKDKKRSNIVNIKDKQIM